jgi:hypothetical protein
MANDLIPFGKYKGQPVEQLQNDPEYTKWLLQQPWFVERYGGIQTLIVNNFKEAADSPDHNAMQARFLNRQFAFSVACSGSRWMPFDDWALNELSAFRSKMEDCDEDGFYRIEFEVGGWDVVTRTEYSAWGKLPKDHPEAYCASRERNVFWGGEFRCELKPTIGEDFPSVLRQVKARGGGGCVLVERFVAESVSFEDVQQMFAMSKVRLIRCGDVVMRDLPQWMSA